LTEKKSVSEQLTAAFVISEQVSCTVSDEKYFLSIG